MFKQKKVVDPEHTLFVSRQAPLLAGLPANVSTGFISSEKQVDITYYLRRSDPHHLPNYDQARRFCDWFVVPLSRERHDWIATAQGKIWERENLVYLYRHAARYLLAHGRITNEIHDRLLFLKPEDDTLLREWMRDVITLGQERL